MDNNFNSKDILDDRDTDLEVMLEGMGKSLLSKIPIIGELIEGYDSYKSNQNNRLTKIVLPAERGEIFDRKGRLVATNEKVGDDLKSFKKSIG